MTCSENELKNRRKTRYWNDTTLDFKKGSSIFTQAQTLHRLLKDFPRPWAVAGGWAVDLFLSRVTRSHHDIEIIVFRQDQEHLHRHLAGWDLRKCVPKQGPISNWLPGEWLALPVHEIHGRDRQSGFELEILLNEKDATHWIYRRAPQVRRELAKTIVGGAMLAPEIVLLYKARDHQDKDDRDFRELRCALPGASCTWLASALRQLHPAHDWLLDL
jgi:Aminoglycoside-2''-adenylyltransferase